MEIKKILVPIDYSVDSHQALQWAASLAEKYDATLVLLHAIPKAVEEVSRLVSGSSEIPYDYYEGVAPPSGPLQSETVIIDLAEKARVQLYELCHSDLKDLKETVAVQVKIAVGKPAEEILRVARDEGAALVVMGTHGRTGLRHVLLGSVTEAVIRSAPCPVFAVRAGVAMAA